MLASGWSLLWNISSIQRVFVRICPGFTVRGKSPWVRYGVITAILILLSNPISNEII
jgi:hypothetical protein